MELPVSRSIESTLQSPPVTHTHTASASDYFQVATPASVQFDAGLFVSGSTPTGRECFTFPLINDQVVEGLETVLLGLGATTGVIEVDNTRADSQAIVFINDDDGKPILVYIVYTFYKWICLPFSQRLCSLWIWPLILSQKVEGFSESLLRLLTMFFWAQTLKLLSEHFLQTH